MTSTIRVVVSVVAAFSTFYFTLLLPFSLLLPGARLWWVRALASLACAVLVTRYVWGRSADMSQGLAGFIATGALVVGAIGFAAGFVGPMILAPGANQGPMLSIFITGPLGFLAGAVGGGITWWAQKTRRGVSRIRSPK